ncbi:MAG TPA: hypothetical protein VFB63_03370, partial [Bryobacteraceae bacterium]|nr:hypothetical protein [Bryobacteraceae bacterium]
EEEDCSKACPVGGSKFGVKWGTPDVIGVQKARESDVVKFPTVILSAEVKVDGGALVTAFGQACAYTLFSHKSYIVVPANSQKDDLDRLESLCVTMGLGLVVFDHMNSDNPNFTFRARSRQFNPHPFYVNINMKQLEKELFH